MRAPLFRPEYNFPLPESHITALQAVDVRLNGLTHGDYVRDSRLGTYTTGATDRDYTLVDQLLKPLDHDHGDVLAIEGHAAGVKVDEITFDYLYPSFQVPHASHLSESVLQAQHQRLDIARHLRTQDPLHYAARRALFRGVEVQYADLRAEEVEDWREIVHDLGVVALFSRPVLPEMYRIYRENDIARRLGEIASKMVKRTSQDQDRPPILSYVAGATHLQGIGRRLGSNGIPHTVAHNFRLPAQYRIMAATEGISRGVFNDAKRLVGQGERRKLLRRHHES